MVKIRFKCHLMCKQLVIYLMLHGLEIISIFLSIIRSTFCAVLIVRREEFTVNCDELCLRCGRKQPFLEGANI